MHTKESVNYWLRKLFALNETDSNVAWQPGEEHFATVKVELDHETSKAIEASAFHQDVNVYKLFLTAICVVWNRYYPRCAFVVNTPFFTNSDALDESAGRLLFYKMSISPGDTSRSLLKHIHTEMISGLQNEQYEINELFERLASNGMNNETALLNLGFCYRNIMSENEHFGRNNIQCFLEKNREQFYLEIKSHNLFPETFSANFGSHIITALKAFIHDLDQQTDAVDILTQEQVAEMHRFSKGIEPFAAAPENVAGLFREQVQQWHNKIAVVSGDHHLTYEALEALSNKVANALLKMPAVKGDVITLLLEPSAFMVAGLLGIIKAGCAYLPLDKDMPAERVRYIMEDCGSRVIITDLDIVSAFPGCTIIRPNDIQLEDPEAPVMALNASDAAYIIYTSGTTGKPKGVIVEHSSMLNYVRWLQTRYRISAADSSVLLSSYSFDLGYTSLWGTILSGGTIHIVPKDLWVAPRSLLTYLSEQHITFLKCTPSLFHTIAYELAINGDVHFPPLSVQLIFLGGEPIRYADIRSFLKVYQGVQFVNHYGPTESTIGVIVKDVTEDGPSPQNGVIIGRPIHGAEAYILNVQRQALPVLIEGEIYIGGHSLARGYVNNAGLTSEKFIAHPFKPGARLYASGDRGYRLPNGDIVFVGRKDDQVKINGYRVEPAEVEKVIGCYDGIQAVRVLAQPAQHNMNYLVAYYEATTAIDLSSLRHYLAAQLPEYMMPAGFVQVDRMPLTANGKLDRKKLLSFYEDSVMAGSETATGDTELQYRLIKIWQEVLNRPFIHIRSSFFESGGHSLLAVKLISRIYKEFSIQLELAAVFQHPTIEKMEQLIRNATAKTALVIKPLDPMPAYAVSHGQLRLWYLHQFEAVKNRYNCPRPYRIKGNLSVSNLQKALLWVVEKHESLRTVFIEEDGMPKQQVLLLQPSLFSIEEVDAQSFSDAAIEEEINKRSLFTFDLAQGPLIKVALFRLHAEECILHMVLHHIITDAWSMEIVIRDLWEAYAALEAAKKPAAIPLAIQYKEFAHWQNERLSEVHHDCINYWLSQFEDVPAPLELPVMKKERLNGKPESRVAAFEIDADTARRLREIAQRNNTTPFTTLFTAINLLLYRYTGNADITLGLPVTGRDQPEFEHIVGFFINVLPVRTRFNITDSFLEVLRQVQETILSGYKWQFYPFDKILETLKHKGYLKNESLFNIVIDHVVAAGKTVKADEDAGLQVSSLYHGYISGKNDFQFTISESDTQLSVIIEYNAQLFEQQKVDHLMAHFSALLKSIVHTPEAAVETFAIVSAAEKEKMLMPASEPVALSGESFINIFNGRLPAFSDRTAIECSGRKWSYAELHEQAAAIAYLLKHTYGVEKGDIVGVMIPRSENVIISLLGILMAGAAFLPVDPAAPQARIRSMLMDADAKAVISLSGLSGPEVFPAEKVLLVDIELPRLQNKQYRWYCNTADHDLAYVIYTSGSTGKPKGVCVSNRSFVNYITWAVAYYFNKEEACRFAYFTALSFDLTLTSIFATLYHGGTIVVFEEKRNIGETIRQVFDPVHNVTAVKMTPSHVSLLQHQSIKGSQVRLCILGGENVYEQQVEVLMNLNPAMKVYNEYGPTEATVGCTVENISGKGPVTIGRPVANTRIYILNSGLQLQPEGITGELFIGGDCLSVGYLNAPELTSEKFIRDPFRTDAVLYRTGDMGCWLPDGAIRLSGRKDEQVKVRGYRIEPGEIEKTLLTHPLIRDAAVITREEEGEHMLVACIVVLEKREWAEWSAFLAQFLPDYMIPSRYLVMDSLPLTANGKVDKARLAAFELSIIVNENREQHAPVNETITKLKSIWSEILGKTNIADRDDFFQIGGYSLNALRMAARIYKNFGVKLDLAILFDHPVLEDLARVIDLSTKKQYTGIEKITAADHYPVSHAQKRVWMLSQTEESSISQHVQEVLKLKADIQIPVLKTAIAQLLARHEILRTVFHFRNDEIVQQVLNEDISDAVFRQVVFDESVSYKTIETEIIRERKMPFDLEKGPLFRITLFQSNTNGNIICFTLHHIITDQGSMDLLFRDLSAAYRNCLSGEKAAALAIQYKDYTVWHNKQLEMPGRKQHIDFWKKRLEGSIPFTGLPFDFARPAVKSYQGDHMSFELDAHRTGLIKEAARKKEVTVFVFLLSSFFACLHKLTGESDLLIGLPVSGRVHDDLENQIGLYLNALPCRISIGAGESFSTLLSKVKEEIVAVTSRQLYPLDMLLSDLNIQRSADRAPLFETVFNYTNATGSNSRKARETLFDPFIFWGKSATAKHDMMLGGKEFANKIVFGIEYTTDLYKRTTITAFIKEFNQLIDVFIAPQGTSTALAELTDNNPAADLLTQRF